MKDQKIVQRVWIVIGACLIISIFLNWLVFKQTGNNFLVIFRSNDFGTNFLGNRNFLWQVPILGIVFIGINFLLSRLFQKRNKGLSKLLFFANIGIAVLVFLISAQIYILNR